MAKLVDALALGASPERGGGSSPPSCTNLRSYELRLVRPVPRNFSEVGSELRYFDIVEAVSGIAESDDRFVSVTLKF